VAIIGLWLVAVVAYAIWQSIQTYDTCLRELCGLGDYPTSHLDAVIRQWPAAVGAVLGLIASARRRSTRTGGTNALLEAAGAFAVSSGVVAVMSRFSDARAGPIAVLGEASAPTFIALFIGCLATAALVIGIRSEAPLLSGARFAAVVIAVEAPHVVAYAFERGPRELKAPVLIAVIPLAAAVGVALVGASLARLLRSPHPRQHS